MGLTGPPQKNLFRLKASIQEYPWGKQGSSSLVAQYGPAAVGEEFEVDEEKTYAEVRGCMSTPSLSVTSTIIGLDGHARERSCFRLAVLLPPRPL